MKLALPSLKDAIAIMTAAQVKNAATANIRYAELFDRQPYAQAGQTSLQFFGRNPSGLSDDATNLRSGKSEINTSQCFIVCGVSCHFEPGADQTLVGATAATSLGAIDDYLTVMRSGRVVFKTGSREDYIENGPLFRFPPMTQPIISGAISDTTTAGGNQRTAMQNVCVEGDMYPVSPKIIMPGDAFELSVRWGASVPVSVAGLIEGRLYGFLADLR